MTRQSLQQAAESRRSIYSLNKNLPVGKDEVVQIVEHAVLHTPSSFNSQSARVVVLFGEEHDKVWQFVEEHDKVWQFVEDALRAVVPADSFEPTAQKLNLFKAGAATILFYEDQNVVKGLQEQFPAYAANFPVWADQANAMVQYAVWTTLAAVGVGANLQHYNPLPDAAIAKAWNIPENWLLRAQMVIGGIEGAAGEKTFEPVAERLKVFGA
ncbi:TPA: nitroreductase family protein [Neisseria meningitidis]